MGQRFHRVFQPRVVSLVMCRMWVASVSILRPLWAAFVHASSASHNARRTCVTQCGRHVGSYQYHIRCANTVRNVCGVFMPFRRHVPPGSNSQDAKASGSPNGADYELMVFARPTELAVNSQI